MATITLERWEAERGKLPDVCICCGDPSDELRETILSWTEGSGVPLSAESVVSSAMEMTAMRVRLPVCRFHRAPRIWKATSLGCGITFGITLVILSLCLIHAADDGALQHSKPYVLWVVGSLVV